MTPTAALAQLAESLFTGAMVLLGGSLLCFAGAAYFLLAESYILHGPIERTKQPAAVGNDRKVAERAGVGAARWSYDFCAQRAAATPVRSPSPSRSVPWENGDIDASKAIEHEKRP